MKIYQIMPAAIFSIGMLFTAPQIATALTADKVQEIAEKVTVLIPLKNPIKGTNENGSGSIIAKQGNTYTILTANHVVCADRPFTEVCKNPYQIKVKTKDGQEYTVDNSTIKKLPELDLAVFQFTSDKNYPVATLANYDPTSRSEKQVQLPDGRVVTQYGQFVFASGWPGVNGRDILDLAYRFSVGRLMPPDKMVGFKIRPVQEGYEAVYTSITFPGMSGGPVFDTDGRIIAVHGQNEGESIYHQSCLTSQRVQIGYSLSIPIQKFLAQSSKAGIQLSLNLQNNPPAELTEDEIDSIGTQYILEWAKEKTTTETNTAIYWANQGNKFWRALYIPEALNAYEKALQIDPNFYPVLYGRGLIKTFERNYDEAMINYSQALTILDEKITKGNQQCGDLKEVQGWVQRLQKHIQPLAKNTPQNQPQAPYAGGTQTTPNNQQPTQPASQPSFFENPEPAPNNQQPPQPLF